MYQVDLDKDGLTAKLEADPGCAGQWGSRLAWGCRPPYSSRHRVPFPLETMYGEAHMLEEGHNYDSHVKKFFEVGFGKHFASA